ncbi:MAG TPA: carboxyl transferase domain-containing protein [Woeseiaceae bacterium]|nr:carboxyl transferase domain-containing protein [Woeseiaceae bacterium]
MTDERTEALAERLAKTHDRNRPAMVEKRHAKGYRTARENLDDLVDTGSFTEYGQLAVAAQRSRRDVADLEENTPADAVITGTGTINAELFGRENARAAVVVYDYSVLAGTQGYFHHRKLDRIFELAEQWELPVVMYTEGGGGRPGDTDVTTQIAGLNLSSFRTWGRLSGLVPRIAINNGYCFAGNAALFGSADVTIATKTSWIGMAGPAMIEGGGLGKHAPTEIGPVEVQEGNGVVDIVADDEAHATDIARRLLALHQGRTGDWECADQAAMRDLIPADRRWVYPVRDVIETLGDTGSFIELRRRYGAPVITGLLRIEGRPAGLIANDCRQLGGAITAQAAEKAARFLQLCDGWGLPVLSLIDTPGFMVGPDSEQEAAVRRMSRLFVVGANITVPILAVVLRKGYGLGAMAMAGGSLAAPVWTASWPTGEFGGMGLEGAVRLGYRKELEAVEDRAEREALFEKLVRQMYEAGKATEAAAHLEIDAVIDPADTRRELAGMLARLPKRGGGGGRRYVDTW